MNATRPTGFLLVMAGALALAGQPAHASERELEKAPPPTTTEEIETPLQRTFLAPARKEPLFPWVRQKLKELPPFFADTQLEARFRTYYLHKDRTDGDISEAWAIGGSLYYRSGWWKDVFSVEAEGFTSQGLFTPDDRDGTGLLAPGQKGYGVLGVANAKLRYRGIVLTGFRQYLGLPFVNKDDSRMTPRTYEALTLANEEGPFRFSTGYIWKTKPRNADEFITMSEAAGVSRDRGLAYASILWQPGEDFHGGVSFGIVPDVLSGVYTESAYTLDLLGAKLRLDGQLEYQRSVGDELLPGESIETWNLGLRASTDCAGAVIRLGFSITDDDSRIFSPYGSNPSYVDLMQRTFNQEDEKAVLVSLSYDFSELGADGLSTIATFVQGWDGRVGGERGRARELDVTLDYRLPERLGLYEGLWLRLRGSWLYEELGDETGTDFRAILRYDFPIL